MDSRFEQVVRPVREEVSDVDEDRWGGVGFGSGREDGDRCPGCGGTVVPFCGACGGRNNLESRLAWALE